MTTQIDEIWKCQVCGNIVELVHVGGGPLVCCNQPMVLQRPNTVEAAVEKHVPVIEKNEQGYLVKVSSVEHPMEETHYIEWIELMVDDVITERHYLAPGLKPESQFIMQTHPDEKVWARAYCNLHGLWVQE